MNLRTLIKKDFGVDLPIVGGPGHTVDNPVFIVKEGKRNDPVGIEYTYLKYIGMGKGIEWETVDQELTYHEDRRINKIRKKNHRYANHYPSRNLLLLYYGCVWEVIRVYCKSEFFSLAYARCRLEVAMYSKNFRSPVAVAYLRTTTFPVKAALSGCTRRKYIPDGMLSREMES